MRARCARHRRRRRTAAWWSAPCPCARPPGRRQECPRRPCPTTISPSRPAARRQRVRLERDLAPGTVPWGIPVLAVAPQRTLSRQRYLAAAKRCHRPDSGSCWRAAGTRTCRTDGTCRRSDTARRSRRSRTSRRSRVWVERADTRSAYRVQGRRVKRVPVPVPERSARGHQGRAGRLGAANGQSMAVGQQFRKLLGQQSGIEQDPSRSSGLSRIRLWAPSSSWTFHFGSSRTRSYEGRNGESPGHFSA